MLLEFVAGGELFSYLRTVHRFDNPTSLFFASEIVMALDYLHSQDMVYRCVCVCVCDCVYICVCSFVRVYVCMYVLYVCM